MATSTYGEVILETSFQESSPKYIRHQNKTSGVCFDIIEELNSRLQEQHIRISYPPINTFLMPWKRLQTYLENGTLDIIVGMAKNKTRVKKYVFSKEPLYTVRSVFAVLLKSTFEYHSPEDLYGKHVIAIQGTKTAKSLKLTPSTNIVLTNSPTAALKMLLAKRGDVVFYHDMGLAYIIKTNHWKNLIRLEHGIEEYDHYIGYNKKVPNKVRSAIDKQLAEMKKDGTLKQILNRYR